MEEQIVVGSDDYHRYIPGVRSNFLQQESWNSLTIGSFLLDSIVSGEAPALMEHAFSITGLLHGKKGQEIYRGQCKVNDQFVFEGTRYQGNGIMFPRFHSVAWDWASLTDQKVPVSCAFFPPNLLEKVAAETLDIDADKIELRLNMSVNDDFLVSVVRQLSKDMGQTSFINRVYAETLTQAFAVHVLRHYCVYEKRVKHSQGQLSRASLQRVTDYMHAHIEEPIGLAELANILGLSEYYFIRLFKQSTGVSPHQYLIKLRIQRAQELLSSTPRSIIDIALSSGYTSPASFSYAFKRVTGVTPSYYRRYK